MEYVSVRPTHARPPSRDDMAGATIHYIDSINPLSDFTAENQFELHESEKWEGYKAFCRLVAADRGPDLVHVHNEAYLIPMLRETLPSAKLLLHVNDEVVTRMRSDELRRLARSCDRILACSDYIGRQMSAAFAAAGVPAPQIDTFYNFVDLTEYDPVAVEANRVAKLRSQYDLGDGPVLLFVGRLIEQKGPHLALRAFRKVAEHHPAARLLFVGAPWYSRENESAFVDGMRREASALDGRVQFTGYVDHAVMPAYYAMADLACVPSIWDDPSPFVAYEAQAMACPVIGSLRGGIPEIVEDYQTGRCIDPFNVSLFSRILRDWLSDPSVRRTVGERGRQRVATFFDLNQAKQRLRTVYDELLSH